MKLISLNIWGGKVYRPLMEFLKMQSRDADIFCFQEVFRSSSGVAESRGARVNIFGELADLLADFRGYFAAEQKGFDLDGPCDFDIANGQASFIKKSHPARTEGSIFVYLKKNQGKDTENLPQNFHYLRFTAGSKKFTVMNLHGIAHPGSKLDTPDRIEQSRRIVDFLEKEKGAKILCGDFNLMPETESIAMIERAGMENLIKTHRIPETRGRLSPFYGKPGYLPFADYVFVSPEVEVAAFRSFDVGVSDHLPLCLEFQ